MTGAHVEEDLIEMTPSDNEDRGGEEGMSAADDKPHLRMRRSFELLLDTGKIIRFEVGSPDAPVLTSVLINVIDRLTLEKSPWNGFRDSAHW